MGDKVLGVYPKRLISASTKVETLALKRGKFSGVSQYVWGPIMEAPILT